MALVLGCGFFVAGTLWVRALSVTEVDVREGSIAVGVRTKVVKIDAEEVLRVVRPSSRGT